jgi:tellurite methyltransferase
MSGAEIDGESAREKWNRRYRGKGTGPDPPQPSAWLQEHRSLLLAHAVAVPGAARPRALDVACGDGRNAVYLAQLGFVVDGVDISDVAIETLRATAAEHGLSIHAARQDLEEEEAAAAGAGLLAPDRYDAVVQVNYLQRGLFAALAGTLRPGGLLIVETYTRAGVDERSRHRNPRYLLEENELLRSFPDLRILHFREALADASGPSRGVASLVAQRRPSPPLSGASGRAR